MNRIRFYKPKHLGPSSQFSHSQQPATFQLTKKPRFWIPPLTETTRFIRMCSKGQTSVKLLSVKRGGGQISWSEQGLSWFTSTAAADYGGKEMQTCSFLFIFSVLRVFAFVTLSAPPFSTSLSLPNYYPADGASWNLPPPQLGENTEMSFQPQTPNYLAIVTQHRTLLCYLLKGQKT